MQEKDIVSMEYFEDPARFADLLNGFLFRGKQIIKPEEVKEANRFRSCFCGGRSEGLSAVSGYFSSSELSYAYFAGGY